MTKSRTKKRSRVQRWIENFLLLAGLSAVGIWAWANGKGAIFQTWDSWVFDRELRGQTATITDYLVQKKQQVTETVRTWCGSPPLPEPPSPPPFIAPPLVERQPVHSWPIENNALIGRLAIPRLHLSAMVREGTGDDTLVVALGHIPGTAMPGQTGNVGVAGHRDTLFRSLREIRKNDLVRLETLAGSYLYEVESSEVVRPLDVGVLKAGQYPEITLVTCFPFRYVGSAPDRFVVKARQVSENPLEQKDSEVLENAAAQGNEVTASSPERAGTGVHHGPQLTSSSDRSDHTQDAPDRLNRSGSTRISFQVMENHSRELTPGILLGITRTDSVNGRVNGWMWVTASRRTIWLRSQPTHQPMAFYGYRDGKRRELVITKVTDDSVTGYLLLPDSANGRAEQVRNQNARSRRDPAT